MELVIHDIKSKKDIKLFSELAERLGLKAGNLSIQEKEDIGLSIAIEEGIKSGFVSEEKVMKALRNIKGKR